MIPPSRARLAPSAAQQEELASLIQREPHCEKMVGRQPYDPTHPALSFASPAELVYPMIRIPTPSQEGAVWVGRLPGISKDHSAAREVDALVEVGITRIVCLVPEVDMLALPSVAPYPLHARGRLPAGFSLVEVLDFGTPPDDERFEEEIVDAVELVKAGGKVLVHCFAGCGRTGTFVSSILVHMGLKPEDAVRLYRTHRGCGPETAEQVAYVFRYAERLASGLARRVAGPS